MTDLKLNLRDLLSTIRISQNDIEMLHFNISNMWSFFSNSYDESQKIKIRLNLKKSIQMVNYLKEKDNIKNHMIKTYLLKLVLACLTSELFKDEYKANYEMYSNDFIKDLIRLKRLGYKSIHNDVDYLKYTTALNKVINAVGYSSNDRYASIGWLSSISIANLQEVSKMVLEHRVENKEVFTTPLSVFFNVINREPLPRDKFLKYLKSKDIKLSKKHIKEYNLLLVPYKGFRFSREATVYFTVLDYDLYRDYYKYIGYNVNDIEIVKNRNKLSNLVACHG